MTKPIQVGDLVRPKLLAAGKHLWLVIGEEIRHAELRYLMIARGSSTLQLYEDDLKKVSE